MARLPKLLPCPLCGAKLEVCVNALWRRCPDCYFECHAQFLPGLAAKQKIGRPTLIIAALKARVEFLEGERKRLKAARGKVLARGYWCSASGVCARLCGGPLPNGCDAALRRRSECTKVHVIAAPKGKESVK